MKFYEQIGLYLCTPMKYLESFIDSANSKAPVQCLYEYKFMGYQIRVTSANKGKSLVFQNQDLHPFIYELRESCPTKQSLLELIKHLQLNTYISEKRILILSSLQICRLAKLQQMFRR